MACMVHSQTPLSHTTNPADQPPAVYHFVCCDTAYCRTPVEDEPPDRVTHHDHPCRRCSSLAWAARCPHCGLVFP